MKIAIIGAGNVGATLGRRLAGAGHDVVYGVRDPASPKALAAQQGGASLLEVGDAVARSEVVLLATPWGGAQDAVTHAGDFGGRILIDATNPIGPGLSLIVGHTSSGGELVQGWARGARVVKCFNTTGVENMADPRYGDDAASMFLCGDDAEARQVVSRLAADIGFDPIDAGPLKQARLLEPLAILWIDQAMVRGAGRGIAFKLLRRTPKGS